MTCTLFAPVPELVFEAVERGREAAGKPRETKHTPGDPLAERLYLLNICILLAKGFINHIYL